MSAPATPVSALPPLGSALAAPRGLATGIGSLPHRDPGAAVQAVLERVPLCPYWPQLPRRSPLESMTLQYLEGLPGLRSRPGGDGVFVDTGADSGDELTAFYEAVLGGQPEPFALSPERAPGFYALEAALGRDPAGSRCVKGHVTGPVTLATSLKDAAGRDVIHDPTFRGVVGELVARKALWQVRRLARFGLPVMIFLDEPVMEVFGSAYAAFDEDAVRSLWDPSLQVLREEGALSGIHCCGNTDWALLLSCGVDVVNFDAYRFLDNLLLYPAEAAAFLDRGGALAWGVVPTDGAAREESASSLLRRLDDGMGGLAAAGVPEDSVRRQSWITPSCGMGSLDEALAERVLELLQEVAAGFAG